MESLGRGVEDLATDLSRSGRFKRSGETENLIYRIIYPTSSRTKWQFVRQIRPLS